MNIHAVAINNPNRIAKQMQELDVYDEGIKIMAPKAIHMLVKLEGISSIAANILKQEMLSLSGEVAVSKGVITGKEKNADCLVIGNLAQYNRLIEKLRRQPFGLAEIARSLKELRDNYFQQRYCIKAGNHLIRTGTRTLVMGIVNLTPDSFSGDGLYKHSRDTSYVTDHVMAMVEEGADILDVGGESTRPGAASVAVAEEISRTIPVIKKIAKKIDIPISIDTYKPEVARRALDAGACIVNDIKGITKNRGMAQVLKRSRAAIITMHMKGAPRTMQRNPRYKSLMTEIIFELRNSMEFLLDQGIEREQIIIDPGIGFGKTAEHNFEIIQRLAELRSLGRPILIGPSRKSFIGKVLNCAVSERLMGTAASIACAIQNGAQIIRVHDVREMVHVAKLTDALLQYN